MRPAIWIAVVLPLLGLPLAGCPQQSEQVKDERGLAAPNEVTTPESETDMKETNAERQQQLENSEQAVQDQAFDSENSGQQEQQQQQQQ